jgi:toxin ParE1/3/4
MGNYILTSKAVADLSYIWNYTVEAWSERQSDKYYLMLLSFCQDLAAGKVTGKNYHEVESDLLGFKAGQHIFFIKRLV